MWGFSSAGRAPALHAGGQEFESPNLQNKKPNDISYSVFYFLRVKFDEKLPMYFRTFQRSCASELRLECFCCKGCKPCKQNTELLLNANEQDRPQIQEESPHIKIKIAFFAHT